MSTQMPSFKIPGVIAETRPLKTKEGAVWATSVKIMAMGGTYETTTQDDALLKRCGAGETGVAEGRFDFFKGMIKLILTNWVPQEPGKRPV